MITSLLQGGLGNQLFQIATTISLATKNDDEAVFSIHNHHLPNQGRRCHNYLETIFRNLTFSSDIEVVNVYREPSFEYREIEYKPQLGLVGFFQSEKYFQECRDDLRQIFSPDSYSLDLIEENYGSLLEENTVFLHVRRGDYLKYRTHHPPCSLDYYNKAASFFPQDAVFLVLSDDIEWCKSELVDDRFVFVENNEDHIDFYLMTLCKNAIIANSSFSWWGAWLGDKETIIAPSQWFGKSTSHDTSDLIPEEWSII